MQVPSTTESSKDGKKSLTNRIETRDVSLSKELQEKTRVVPVKEEDTRAAGEACPAGTAAVGSQSLPNVVFRSVETLGYPSLASAFQALTSDKHAHDSMLLVHKLLSNILKEPDEEKVRRLRLQNPKIQKGIVDAEGGMEVLQACGFEIVFEPVEHGDEEEGFAVLPMGVDLSAIVAAVKDLDGLFVAPPSKKLISSDNIPPGGRNTILELPIHVDAGDIPDWFFEQSSSEIKRIYMENRKKREQSQVLMTKAMRERLQQRNQKKIQDSVLVIKVRAPEGTKIRGDFNPGEKMCSLFAWVADCLVDPMLEFDLISPDRRPLGDNRFEDKSLKDIGITSSVTLNLAWQGDSIREMKQRKAFREDIR